LLPEQQSGVHLKERKYMPHNLNMKLSKQQKLTLLSILIITPIGFYSKFYHGPAAAWVNYSLGGLFYVIFWCLLLYFFIPKCSPKLIAILVLTITCILECLQLWHPPFLEMLRANFVGRTILGNSFHWSDFPYYFIGCGFGWLWLRKLQRIGSDK